MATEFELIIGNKNYSSWSMRGWLACRFAGIDFEETLVPLFQGDYQAQLAAMGSAPARVPMLRHGEVLIWDSLAILEYVNELKPEARLWPLEQNTRAWARSICAEMHSGFAALRQEVPMNIRTVRQRSLSDAAWQDIARIESIWTECLKDGSKFLFGEFGAADIFYAPVVTRMRTIDYQPERLQGYCDRVFSHPLVRQWCDAAETESWVIEASE